jgi:hypothetical protein
VRAWTSPTEKVIANRLHMHGCTCTTYSLSTCVT